MSSTSKRLLAAVLCVLMTLGLFVPAGAAPATLGGEYAVVEVPAGDDDAIVAQPAAAGDIVIADERPVAVDRDEEATLLATSDFLLAAGDLETAYATWEIGSGVTSYTASVIDSTGKETKLDNQLIREYPGYMRVDALGLKAGTYKIKVTANTGASMTTGDLTVKAHERTGFAFVGGTASGAYNDDGTLKSNAQVIYVTKGSELEAYQSSGVWSGKDDTQKNKPPRVPTCVRIIGLVELSDTAQFQDWTGGLTIEGVGSDAMLTGGGVFIKGCSNVEVRNLGVKHVPKSGKNDLIAIEQTNDHIWVHNCDYFYGFAGSGDQAKGDGSLDVKESHYCTFSYNHFWDSGKCSLLGMHKDQDYMTYHHNWFDHSDSRHPRIRIAKRVHVYNNYYDGCSKYGVGAAENSGAFVEANYFRNTKYPMLISMQGSDNANGTTKGTFSDEPGGIIKAYNNTIIGAKALIPYDATNAPEHFDAYVAKTRDEKVPSTVKALVGGTTYTNFDTEIDIGVKASQVESPEDARTTVTRWAGRVGGGDLVYEFDDATQDTNYGVIPELTDMLNNYKTTLVSVGGAVTKPVSGGSTPAEHTHIAGTWMIVTPAGCDAKTQELVNGLETKSCTICGEVLESRTLAGAHSNDGQGKCTVCGYATGNGGGPVASGNARTLKASDFKMTSFSDTDKKKCPLTAEELAKVADGYFTMDGEVNKRIPKTGAVGDTAQFFDLSQSGSNGIKFTVSAGGAPATVTASFSSSGDKNTSALVLEKDGAKVSNSDGAAYATQKTTTATSVTFKDLAAGTYIVKGSQDGGAASDARLYTLTVSETEAPCEHTGTPIHHAAKSATCAEDGNIEYWTCTDICKKNFSDAAMTKMVDDVTTEATGEHTWGAWVTNADGEKTRECSVCGEEENEAGEIVTPTPVDTKGLEAAITAAEKLTAVKVDTDAANVDKGTSWVTKSVMDALKSAIATAKALDTATADQTAVDNATKTLYAAVDTFMAAVQEGTKESGGDTATVHTFESKTLPNTAANDSAPGPYAEDSYFTLAAVNKKTKYDESSKEWTAEAFGDNAYDPSGDHAQSKVIRFNMGGKSTKDGPGVKFTTTATTAKVQIWWAQNSGDSQDKNTGEWTAGDTIYQIALLNAGDASKVVASELAHTGSTPGGEGRVKKNDPEYTELTAPTAGEYMVGCLDGGVYIFKIVVTEGASGGTATTPVDKSALDKAIDDAVAAIAKPTVSKDGKDVAPTSKWVTQAEKDTFQAAITAAKAAKLTAASDADVTAAVNTLKAAAAAFEAAQANGTKGQGTTTEPTAVTGVKLNKVNISLKIDDTATLTATVQPTTATNQGVYWTSSDTAVVTVDQKGVVKAIAEGNATITVKTDEGGFTAQCKVSVSKASTPSSGGHGGGGGGGLTNPSPAPAPATLPFVDVAASAWYASGVQKAYDQGLMKGTDTTHFSPDGNTTRAMMMTILARLNGQNTEGGETWYAKGMAWAMEVGISDGTAPESNVTREQVAAMLYRYAAPAAVSAEGLDSRFSDAASVSDWAKDAVAWAVASGIINGKGNGTLDPQGFATRAQICTMLIRFMELKK